MNHWVTPKLKRRVRDVFEPRYRRALSDDEINEIADNLAGYMEALLKSKWEKEYGTTIQD